MKARTFLWLLAVGILSMNLVGCGSLSSRFDVLLHGLPVAQRCMPSDDLPASKELPKLPVVDTSNDEFYKLFTTERKAHGMDVQDYNSLYDLCVKGEADGRAANS